MINNKPHTFHIPVMGLAYTIDSPIKVAHFGIDSVISIVDDELAEKMNAFYCEKFELPYRHITAKLQDYRAQRITAYLNTVDRIVKRNYELFCAELSQSRQALENFIGMLPQVSELKQGLEFYISSRFNKSNEIFSYLKNHLVPGSIDVNIMTKVDKVNYDKNGSLPVMYNDAHASLRGFANSTLSSSLVLSAGMNPSLYSYIAEFSDFFPDQNNFLKKKVILKVSDFRSAFIQGSFLAKKGIWVSEYRIESGLNCGGHAFATDGLLLGPIMEEFRHRKEELITTTHQLLQKALEIKNSHVPNAPMGVKITIQGGVGTAEEHQFLLQHYKADSVGWGSPFLMVPEAVAIDAETRNLLAASGEKDFYRSDISPLGVPFNTVKGSSNELIKQYRIEQGKAGSSCPKKLLAMNMEFDDKGICTASRKYQQLKLAALDDAEGITIGEYNSHKEAITVKSCLCVGLANPAYIDNNIKVKGEEQGVVICPGPNLAYFDKEVSLRDMVRHIYGCHSVLAEGYRPNMFIKELGLYAAYLKNGIEQACGVVTAAQLKKWNVFKENLLKGIGYYENLFGRTSFFTASKADIFDKLGYYKTVCENIKIPQLTATAVSL